MKWAWLLLLSIGLFAQEENRVYRSRPKTYCCREEIQLNARLLLWKPLSCSAQYAEALEGVDVHVKSVDGDFCPGFRLGGRYQRESAFLAAYWSYYHTRDTDRVVNSAPLTGLNNISGIGANANESVEATLKWTYSKIDIHFGTYLHDCCGCQWRAYLVGRYLSIQRKLNLDIVGPTALERRLATYEGYGLGVAVAGDIAIPCNFSLGGSFTATWLGGDRRSPLVVSELDGEPLTTVHRRTFTCFIPGIDVEFYLRYNQRCSYATLMWDIGYEVDYYFNPLEVTQTTSPTERTCANAGFGGPYFSFTVSF